MRACLMMADLEQAEHGATGRVREWLARASRAPRDPAWIADGIVSDRWLPTSPVTGRLDAFVWQTPPDLLAEHPAMPAVVDDVTADLDDKGEKRPEPVLTAREAEPPEAAVPIPSAEITRLGPRLLRAPARRALSRDSGAVQAEGSESSQPRPLGRAMELPLRAKPRPGMNRSR